MRYSTDSPQAYSSEDRPVGELIRQLPEQVSVLVASGAALLGKSHLKRATPPVPKDTAASVKTDVEVLKERARR